MSAIHQSLRQDDELADELVAELYLGRIRTVAFVVLGEEASTLPLYRVAIATARRGWAIGIEDPRYWLVTPERVPLANCSAGASAAAAARLEPEGITFIGSTFADIRPGIVLLDPQDERLRVDRIVTLSEAARATPRQRAGRSRRFRRRAAARAV
ncbi:MAG TPA: hypothetical protein VEX67_00325 [Solirubrobacteraceae bacterium]|nr:hypothetical protein [Solirubrobacteraceae bacterium]